MPHANRLSHRACNVAFKGWVSGQICPARAVCQNPVEKTVRNPYFLGICRFPERSCDSHPSPVPKWRLVQVLQPRRAKLSTLPQ